MRLVNRKVLRDYSVVEKLEAGIVLSGSEVKSLRSGQGSLLGSRIMVRANEVWVLNMDIPRYRFDGRSDEYDSKRERKLLISKKERLEFGNKARSSGLTMVPLKVYNKGRFVKVEIGLVRGKRKYEKRELLKKRKQKREIERRLKT